MTDWDAKAGELLCRAREREIAGDLKVYRLTVVAAGGAGVLWRETSNPSVATADAMAMAFRQLKEYGVLKNNPLREYIAATSVGLVGGVPMVDLCYEEDSQADVDMNVVMTGAGQFVEVQATAEHTPFDDAQMAQMMDLARAGISELVIMQREIIGF